MNQPFGPLWAQSFSSLQPFCCFLVVLVLAAVCLKPYFTVSIGPWVGQPILLFQPACYGES